VLQTDTKFADSEIVNYCAFDFPGVIYTVGANRWGELREAYFKLCSDLQWKVRRPLAHSLHEVATLVGGEATVADLLSIFETFLKDLDEVKVGVVRHLASFLAVLPSDYRERYLPVISDITNETSNWRFRKLMARQLGALSALFSPEVVNEKLVPILVQLCQDSVARVRQVAHREVGILITRLGEDEDRRKMKGDLIAQIVTLGTPSPESSYVDRQIFVRICGSVSRQVPAQCFSKEFLPTLLLLVGDRIPNVRIAVAQVMRALCDDVVFSSNEDVQRSLELLQKDKDRDVVFFSRPPPEQRQQGGDQKRKV